MTKRVIVDEPYGFFNVAANRELRDQAWIAEYMTTGMFTEAGPKTCWDSPDADVIDDLRRMIEFERNRVYEPYYPTPVSPKVYDAVASLAREEALSNAAWGLEGSQVRGMLSTRDELVCRQALEALGC